MNPIQQLNQFGQSVWYDNVQRDLIDSGEMQKLIELGVTGVTSNPTILERAITSSTAYDKDILRAVNDGKTLNDIYDSLVFDDIQRVADLLLPVYQNSFGADGYVSIEVPPTLAANTEETIKEGQRIFSALNRPNIMIKVPATPEGIPAIRTLISKGINVNVTLIFSVSEYEKVIEAYLLGLEDRLARGESVKVASVASFFISRVDSSVDPAIDELQLDPAFLGKAAIANAKLAYRLFQEQFTSERFNRLKVSGAFVQRPLWASTSTKNPNYPELLYVSPLVGPDSVNTMPPKTLEAVLSKGNFCSTLEEGISEAKQILTILEQNGISISKVTDKLLNEGVTLFEESFENLMGNLKSKAESIRSSRTFA
ncbi:transaldolase [Fodinisporobacter ferrooxydans]|uniref:Transaldolase n=1 Tax=Fodinisporobacter ferrooxydans TaxID=2901836 RepID=A0ABY4CLR5_9BACL|nr:transaldolase [Alicyclobacillaceae bacterium MYW30-H2]